MKILPWIVALPLLAQNQGSVEGTIRSLTSDALLGGVKVTLTGPKEYRTTTDAFGAFRVPAVNPGEYTAAFDANFYMMGRRPFRVTAGETARLKVSLLPLGKISGRVLDSEGLPAARVQIEMIRLRGGSRSVSRTDEAGRFGVRGIGPGSYVLLARPQKESNLKPPDAAKRTAWAPIYYPNGLEQSQAAPIVVRNGADLSGYDLRLRMVPVYRVRGTVLDADGNPAARATVKLQETGLYRNTEAQAVSGDDGTFELGAVLGGTWRLLAELGRGKAAIALNVSRQDLEDVKIRLLLPFTLSGFVERDEPRDAQGKRKLSVVHLIPADGLSAPPLVAVHEQDGTVRIKDVVPGRYTIKPVGFVPGYYVESVKLGEQDVLGRPVQLMEGSPPFRVVFKANGGRVRGTVEKCEGASVVLVPQDEAFVDDEFIRSAVCQAGGRFEVGSLRPGDYYAFAFDRVDSFSLGDPTFIRMLVPFAAKVHVDAGEAATVDLKVTAWPE